MIAKKIIVIVFIGLSLILAACSPAGSEPVLPGTGSGTPLPGVPTELPPEAAIEAQRQLSESLGVPVEQIPFVSYEQMDWQDSCLGLGQPNESCAQVITPGWRIIVEVSGQQYEIRTDETAQAVRWQVVDAGTG